MRDRAVRVGVAYEAAAALHRQGRLDDAERGYRRVLALDPEHAAALNMLGLVHHVRGEGDAAVSLMRASLSIREEAPYWYNLGLVLESRGDMVGAIAAYRQASALDPADVTNWSSAIFAGDLHPYSRPAVRLADRRAFNHAHCAALTAAAAPHTNDRDPERRLRVGYLSADFIDHSAGMVFGPVIEGHDRESVEVYLYWQQRQPADRITERFRQQADHWRAVHTLSDGQLADQIRADRIDILVDLAGYSNGHRLLALARKPAPIIMTGWGHVTGLGIDAVDYVLADAITVPEEQAHHHAERVLRLPSVLAFDPRPPYPDVAPAPAATNGYVTFGYLGRATKTSEPVWSVWATILACVPKSRLVFKGREYGDAGYRRRILEFFAGLRIESNRIGFMAPTTRADHLAAYGRIDVALDTFPQNGGVTTLEACLMGVPSVTLLGDHLNGRIGASILATIGRGQFVAVDVEQYADIAVALAGTAITRAHRQAMRDALLGSVICDGPAYAGAVEELYRQAWRAWVSEQQMRALNRRLTLVGA